MTREDRMDKEDVFLETLTEKQAEMLLPLLQDEHSIRCLRVGLGRIVEIRKGKAANYAQWLKESLDK